MNEISIPMALLDLVPVILFLLTNLKLMGSLYNKMTRKTYALFSGGALLLFAGALCKILWKFLYALGICDYPMLSECFFPIQPIGFIFMDIALTKMLKDCRKSKKETNPTVLNAATMPVITTKVPFLILTFFTMTYYYINLSIISAKTKQKKPIILIVLSYLGMMGNCFIGTITDGSPIYHWIAEFTHVFAQVCLLWGTVMLCNSGLKEEDCFNK